jgi:hypothetical protein
MINAKRKGARNELKTRDWLEKRGYKVTKSGGSLGEFDLIAINKWSVLLVQVKSNRNAPPKERKAIEDFVCPICCEKEIWIWSDYAREPKRLFWDFPYIDKGEEPEWVEMEE